MVTFNRDLLMAFVYFDQCHCGYLLEKDLEEILYTLGLHLSRAQVAIVRATSFLAHKLEFEIFFVQSQTCTSFKGYLLQP